jgi:polyhydroxyalkanoate synthesis regulator phasin
MLETTITKTELKALIHEVVREVNEPEYFTNAQKAEEIIKSLIARGAKNNRRFREYISDLRYQAKLADAAVIRGEVEKVLADRKKKTKWMDRHDEPEFYAGPPPEYPPIPYTQEDWKQWTRSGKAAETAKYKEPVGKMSPELRAKFSAIMKARLAKKKAEEPPN